MNIKHTPEPWVYEYGSAYADISGKSVRVMLADRDTSMTSPCERDRNVERTVKCVNACAGIEDPAAYIEAMRRELRRLVDLCDTEATMFDGSNPDTRAAHALLGDFDKPADEDDGGWRY